MKFWVGDDSRIVSDRAGYAILGVSDRDAESGHPEASTALPQDFPNLSLMLRGKLFLTCAVVMFASTPAIACDESAFTQIPFCEIAERESDPAVIARECPFVYFSVGENGQPSGFFLHLSQENAELEQRLQMECGGYAGRIMETVAFFEQYPDMRVYLGRSN